MRRLTILGATGSIGLSTLDVLARHPQRYEVFALSAFTRLAELQALCLRHRPQFAVVEDTLAARRLQEDLQQAGLDLAKATDGDQRIAVDFAKQSWTLVVHPRPEFHAAMPVRGMLKHYMDEFAYHVEHKRCIVPAYV